MACGRGYSKRFVAWLTCPGRVFVTLVVSHVLTGVNSLLVACCRGGCLSPTLHFVCAWAQIDSHGLVGVNAPTDVAVRTVCGQNNMFVRVCAHGLHMVCKE